MFYQRYFYRSCQKTPFEIFTANYFLSLIIPPQWNFRHFLSLIVTVIGKFKKSIQNILNLENNCKLKFRKQSFDSFGKSSVKSSKTELRFLSTVKL